MGKVIRELQDLRYLKWSYSRHSSGTAGSFLKAYENVANKRLYYKLSNYNSVEGIIGHECVNEIVVARLLEKMDIEHLDYDLIHALVLVDGKEYETYLSRSNDFKRPGQGKIALDVFYEMKRMENESVIDFMGRFGWRDFLDKLLVTDYLILNRDRHGANIEVLKNRENESFSIAPIFDNGLSLIFNCKDDAEIEAFDDLEDRKVQCFFGGSSARENLKLLSDTAVINVPAMDAELRAFLFLDLDGVVTTAWMDKVFDMLKRRCGYYESIRTF